MIRKSKSIISLLSIVFIAFIFAACSNETNAAEQENSDQEEVKTAGDYYTFTDALSNQVILKESPQRVVSLVGSYSETWLLAGGSLAGVTDDVEKEGRMEIGDMKVVGTIKEPNLEEVLALIPDFVLLTPDVTNQLKIAETLEQLNINHAFFKVEGFEDYLNMLDICTDITDRKDLYEENGLKIQKDIEDILFKVDNMEKEEHKFLFVRAYSSGAKAKKDDNITCTMLDNLGTVNIAAQHPSLFEDLSIEEIIEEDPDFIFVTTMGDEQKALDVLKNGIEANPAWSTLSAVENDRYILLPKELFHYKPNAKWGESYRYLAEIIYPEIFE